ncbi:MAG TPA: bacteriohemerythrin [Anaeromyxobacter sp.]|nr:bacteriohemerythrin [Anaeromyxobacter sp.]
MIQWTADLATGIALIDEQHRGLYATVAKLHQAMRQGRMEVVPEVLEALQAYVGTHFATEEGEMEAAGYPGLAAHRDAHQAFVVEFLKHRAALARGATASGVVALSAWLGEWLRDHVRRVDGEMARFLRTRNG